MNEKVRDKISKLFVEDRKIVVYLSNSKAEIKQGEDWGVAFGVKNLEKGTAQVGQFSYEVSVNDPDIRRNCGINEQEAKNWIKNGRAGSFRLNPGDINTEIIRFSIPENAPICIVRFRLDVDLNNQFYDSQSFDISVKAK